MDKKQYYEVKVLNSKDEIIYHSIVFAYDDVEALAELFYKFSGLFVAGIGEDEKIVINKRVD